MIRTVPPVFQNPMLASMPSNACARSVEVAAVSLGGNATYATTLRGRASNRPELIENQSLLPLTRLDFRSDVAGIGSVHTIEAH